MSILLYLWLQQKTRQKNCSPSLLLLLLDPGSRIRDPGSGIRDPGSGIRDPESEIRHPDSEIRDPGSGDPG